MLALGLLAVAAPALADTQIARFYGYAYDLDDGRYLYTEVHAQRIEDERWTGGRIRYYDAGGALLGEKTLDFSVDPYIPRYDYRLPALGYHEGIAAVGERIEMFKSVHGGAQRRASVERRAPMAADSGFHSFLRSRFDALMAGRTVSFRFVVAGQLDVYRFRARRIKDTRFEGRPAVQIEAQPDSLLRLFAPELLLTYDPDTRRLLEYRGPSNVLDPATGEAYQVRIDYFATAPADAPRPLPPLE